MEWDDFLRHLLKLGVSRVWIDSLDSDQIFYAVVGVCASLFALRAMVSVLRLAKAERLGKVEGRSRRDIVDAQYSHGQEAVLRHYPTRAEPAFGETSIATRRDSFVTGLRTRLAGIFLAPVSAYLGSFCRGFSGKMILTFTGTIAILGILIIGIIFLKASASLKEYAIQRAKVLAQNIGDSATAYIARKNTSGLREFLRKVTSAPGVAYAIVEDRNENILAHSFSALPPEIQSAKPSERERDDKLRTLFLAERLVYEVSIPISEGQISSVRVALWKAKVDAEVRATMVPMIKMITAVLLVVMLLTGLLVWRITHPILRLVRTAQQISLGDLDTPLLGIADSTEFGELSRALERMRSSVKAALVRLREEP